MLLDREARNVEGSGPIELAVDFLGKSLPLC
jgi:hypothetical protein